MAEVVIRSGLGDLEEVWGTEVTLYYPGLYAGATDVVGIYGGTRKYNHRLQANQQTETTRMDMKITLCNWPRMQSRTIMCMTQRYSLE